MQTRPLPIHPANNVRGYAVPPTHNADSARDYAHADTPPPSLAPLRGRLAIPAVARLVLVLWLDGERGGCKNANMIRFALLPRIAVLVSLVIFAELSAGLTSTQTHAGLVVFDTLPPAASTGDGDTALSHNWILGQSFLSGSGVQLTSVKALLSSSNLSSTGTAEIALWSINSQGELGSKLASHAFADSTVTSGSSQVYTFDPTTWTGSVSLAPTTEYWITLTSVTPSAVMWGGTYSSAGFGVANTDFLYGNTANPASGIVYGSSTGGTYNMEIQVAGAAPIPEPGTWAAMAIFAGGAAFAGLRRRRQHNL